MNTKIKKITAMTVFSFGIIGLVWLVSLAAGAMSVEIQRIPLMDWLAAIGIVTLIFSAIIAFTWACTVIGDREMFFK